jgi:membrane fusion protein (multidrug efflux system)
MATTSMPQLKADPSASAKGDVSEPSVAAKDEPAKRPNPAKRVLIGVVAALVVLAGVAYWYHGTFYEETDDAQIDGYISNVAARVGGTVVAVHVEDNQPVTEGQLLVELDPTDLRVARDLARASLAQAEAQLRAEQSTTSVTETSNQTLVTTSSSELISGQAGVAEARQAVAQAAEQVKQAEADAQLAELEKNRSRTLLASGAIAQAEYDRRQATAEAARAHLQATREGLEAARRRVDEQLAKTAAAASRFHEAKSNTPDVLAAKQAAVELRQAGVDAARAALEQAELNLSYARVTAPISGIVGKRAVNIGDRVGPGQPLLGITQTSKLWVTANFRETQLERMQPGQLVSVHVDALDADFDGKVESIAAATGARYSLFPPENASGNYVKVVQRLPVRIALRAGQPGLSRLRPGMSVEPQVRVK